MNDKKMFSIHAEDANILKSAVAAPEPKGVKEGKRKEGESADEQRMDARTQLGAGAVSLEHRQPEFL